MIIGTKVKLREKKLSDARNDYLWQTDAELSRLDAAPLAGVSYQHYLLSYSNGLRYAAKSKRTFAIDTLDGNHIGNCTYYNIDETAGEAELGIMFGDSNYRDNGYGADAVAALIRHMFETVAVNRIHLKTLDWNGRAQSCFQKCGFQPCGHIEKDRHRFVTMELTRKQWAEQQQI